jgi:hypothetical protein
MKNILVKSFMMLSILTLFTACPYESGIPIDKPSVKVYNDLLGKWIRTSDQESDNPTYYIISKIDDFWVKINKNEFNSSDSTYSQTNYSAYISVIGKTDFLNIQEEGQVTFYLYKFVLSNNQLSLFELTDNIDEHFTDSEELKAFIAKYQDLSFFFNKDEEVYYKAD